MLVLASACGDADVADTCAPDGSEIVSAGRLPESFADVRFTELWRVGGADEDAHFSVPLPLAVSREGRAAIADFELGEVFIVERDGTWRGRIARRGMGPGELSAPVAAVWDDDGGLHVYDLGRPAIVHFAADLTHTGEERAESEAAARILASGKLDWAGVQPSGATVLLPGPEVIREGAAAEVALRVARPTGAADTLRVGTPQLIDADGHVGVRVPGSSRVSAAVGAGGTLALIGGAAGWLVDVYDDNGSVELRMCAVAPDQPLTDAERGRGAGEEHRVLAAAFMDAAPPVDPARYGRIVVGADGTIWVQRERPSPYPAHTSIFGDPGTTFDVFSRAGVHLRTMKLPAGARLQGALDDTIWVYEVDDLDEVSVVAYRLAIP